MDWCKLACFAAILTVLMLLSSPVAAGDDEPMLLPRRYLAPLEGFSLRPPAGTSRIKQPSPSLLVSWTRRDEKTGAIAWTLSVQRVVESKTDIELGPYSNALAEKLRKQENFKLESVNVGAVAGVGAIHLVGITGGPVRSWQRQAWVLIKPGRFLIFSITGPEGMKDLLNKVFDAVLGTVELNDPDKAIEARKENIARGGKLLAELTAEKLRSAIRTELQWYLLKMDNRDVGFMRVSEAARERSDARGVTVIQHVMMRLPGDQLRLLKRDTFSTADRSVEMWTEWLAIGEGNAAIWMMEQGLKQAELIVCTISGPKGETTNKKQAPQGIYLPRAMGYLLPRLISLSEPAVYGFAAYTSAANDFDMRTLSVMGPGKITINGRRIDCVQLTDQLAADAEPVQLWVDTAGKLLRMKSPDGLTIEAVSYAAALRKFYDAEVYIRQLDQRSP